MDVSCEWVVGNDIMSYQHLANQRLTIGTNVTKDWLTNAGLRIDLVGLNHGQDMM